MAFGEEDVVAQVKEQADIVQIIGENVELRRSGSRHVGLCPFHGEKTPSFSVNGNDQFFHCFGCGESGDVFSYVMKYHSMTFPEALKMLASKYGIVLPEKKRSPREEAQAKQKELMFAVNSKVQKLYSDYLMQAKGAAGARSYLQKRGVSNEFALKYGLCYAPSQDVEGWHFLGSHLKKEELELASELGLVAKKEKGGFYDRFRDRILFPINDLSGRVCGFGGRIIGNGQPKYMNSPDSLIFNKSRLLLGLYQQKEAIRKSRTVILVEGNFDMLSLAVNGVENVVAPLGTALTREQLRLVKRYADNGIMLFDGDAAGGKAAVRSVPLFLAEQMAGKVSLLPQGDDPDTFIRREGKKSLLQLVEKAAPLPEFVYEHLVGEHGLSLDGKSRIIEELKPLIQAASSSLQRSVILAHFSEKLGLGVATLEKELRAKQERTVPVERENPEPVIKRKIHPVQPVKSLDVAQKRFVQFMILNPAAFNQLEDAGIRQFLEGSCGEILFLQMKEMLKKNPDFEPEELMSSLPEGPERAIMAEVLLGAGGGEEEPQEADVSELVAYLRVVSLRRESEALLQEISVAEKNDNMELLQELLIKKVQVDAKLQEIAAEFDG